MSDTGDSISVRPCTDVDLALLTSSWPVPGDVHESHFENQQSGASRYLVAWRADSPLGSAVIRWREGEDVSPAGVADAELCHLQVRPEFRRLGVATQLIETAMRLAVSRGCGTLAVGVADDNLAAKKLYTGLGFRRTGASERSEYDWADERGQRHHASELNEILAKRL